MSVSFIAACQQRSKDAITCTDGVEEATNGPGISALSSDVFSVLLPHMVRAHITGSQSTRWKSVGTLLKDELEQLRSLKQAHTQQRNELTQKLLLDQKLPKPPDPTPCVVDRSHSRYYSQESKAARRVYYAYREDQHRLAVQMQKLQQRQGLERVSAYETACAAAEEKASALWPCISNAAGTIALVCKDLDLAVCASPHWHRLDMAAERIQEHVRRCSQNRHHEETRQYQVDRMKGRISSGSCAPHDPKNGPSAKRTYQRMVFISLYQHLSQLEPWFDAGFGGFKLYWRSAQGSSKEAFDRFSRLENLVRVFDISGWSAEMENQGGDEFREGLFSYWY